MIQLKISTTWARGPGSFFHMCLVLAVGVCLAGAGSAQEAAGQAAVCAAKENPGHYVSVKRSASHDEIKQALGAGVRGVQKRYRWADLEPEKGRYDLSAIRADLDFAAANDFQLVAFIEDKSFTDANPAPQYLVPLSAVNRKGGFTLMRWNPVVYEAMQALLAAVGEAFDCEPHFEGIAIQESAPGLDKSVLKKYDYSPEKYRDALIALLVSAADSMPNSKIFWYMNFLPGNQAYLEDVAVAVAAKGVAMGGPDVLPDTDSLKSRVYPLYDRFAEKMTLFGSMQFDSYAHPHASPAGTRYWTMQEMFEFARDELHVTYLFWNLKTWRKPKDSYDWSDAAPVIGANPSFNTN